MRDIEQIRRARVAVYKPCADVLQVAAKSATYPHGHVEGYLSTFNNVDSEGDIIRPGAWAKTIRERVPAGRVPLMRRHLLYGGGVPDVVGAIREASEDSHGLYIRAPFGGDDHAQAVRSKAASGQLRHMSAGFLIVNATPIGKTGGFDMRELILIEGTVVREPANEQAIITRAKGIREELAGSNLDDPRLASFLDLVDQVVEYVSAKADAWGGGGDTDTSTTTTATVDPPATDGEPDTGTDATAQPPDGLTPAERMEIEAELARAELALIEARNR